LAALELAAVHRAVDGSRTANARAGEARLIERPLANLEPAPGRLERFVVQALPACVRRDLSAAPDRRPILLLLLAIDLLPPVAELSIPGDLLLLLLAVSFGLPKAAILGDPGPSGGAAGFALALQAST
jgi:hypothetical protein